MTIQLIEVGRSKVSYTLKVPNLEGMDREVRKHLLSRDVEYAYTETPNLYNVIVDGDAYVFPYTGGIQLIIPKTPKTTDAISDGEIKEIKKLLSDFATKYLAEKENEDAT